MPTYEDLLNDQIENLEQFVSNDAKLVVLEIRMLRMELVHLTRQLHDVVEALACIGATIENK